MPGAIVAVQRRLAASGAKQVESGVNIGLAVDVIT
jgi:hypothetical protein